MSRVRDYILNWVLNGADDGVLLVQSGDSYELVGATRDHTDGGLTVAADDDGELRPLGAGSRFGLRRRALRWALNGTADAWLLVQSGNSYELVEAEYESDAGAYVVELDGAEQYYEDVGGMMGQLEGVPFGLANDDARVIVDADTAAAATAADAKVEDRGEIPRDAELSIDELRESMTVGTFETADGPAQIINPFHRASDEPDVVDLSSITRVMKHAGAPDAPRKAADNAVEAERATQGMSLGTLTDWVKIVGSFLMGALVVEYISGSSGGGGVEVPLVVSPALEPLVAAVGILI